MDKRINNISIRGRVAYLILCFEKYVMAKYPERNWKSVSELMWKICDKSDYIDCSAYRFVEITPEHLYKKDNYADSNFKFLSEDEYNQYIAIVPSDDDNINVLMHSIFDVAIEYAYCGIPKGAPDTIPYIEDVENVMLSTCIDFPDISLVTKYVDPEDWWGDPFDGRYLSFILK